MSIWDDSTYAPLQGDLIDRILGMPSVQPSAGFPASPMNAQASAPAPAAAPQPQNAPMPIGDYSMPRIGSGFLDIYPQHDPHTGETIQPAAPPAQPAAPGFLSTAAAALHSMAQGGSIYGAVTGNYDDPKSLQQAQLQRAYTSLVNAGMPANKAQAAVLGGPEVAKALIEQHFGPQTLTSLGQGYVADKNGNVRRAYTPEQNDSFSIVQTGQDGLGAKTFAKMNKATGDITPIAPAPGATTNTLGDASKTGEAYLATLPADMAGRVKAMVEGRQPFPGSLAMSRPYWQNTIAAAQQYDPTFDATNWSGRVAGVKDFTSGKSSEMVRSANQALHHTNALLDSADALYNGNYPSLNWVGNKFNEATGGGEPGAFMTNAHAVADEMGKMFKGGNLSDSEIHAWEANLSPNMSPAQQRAQIGKLSELLHGALDALEEKRIAAIGPMAAEKAGPLIKPEGQAILKRIDAWLKSGSGGLPSGWSVQVR